VSLSVSDIIEPAPPAAAMQSYTDSVLNSNCADISYMCAGTAVTKAAADFVTYS